jgi:predicted dinucleotide-binding enzyme
LSWRRYGAERKTRLRSRARRTSRATNPLVFEQGKLPRLALGHTDSGGEQIQRWLLDAKVVKAFNTNTSAHMVDPDFPNGPPTMFYCGNDSAAKETVAEICRSFGLDTADCGTIEAARELEALCILWVRIGFLRSNWNQGFKLLSK